MSYIYNQDDSQSGDVRRTPRASEPRLQIKQIARRQRQAGDGDTAEFTEEMIDGQ
jgi:hypothetical protein